jgi:hypothetical protein
VAHQDGRSPAWRQETATLGGGERTSLVVGEVRMVLQHGDNKGVRMERPIDDGELERVELTERGRRRWWRL